MSVVKRALWVIERHLDKEASLADLAGACQISPTHLSHAFADTFGLPVTAYIRGRRLTLAARALASGAPDILQVALSAGYGSHQAFSRAFRKQFGATPVEIRSARTTSGIELVEPLDMMIDHGPGLSAPSMRRAPAMLFVGISKRFRLDMGQQIPELWQSFMSLYPIIGNRKDPVPAGISAAFDPDGWFDYSCGVEVNNACSGPPGTMTIHVPAATYAIFRHRGHVTAIGGTYRAIWNQALPENGWTIPDSPILERHDTGFDPSTGEGGVSIWVPIVLRPAIATGPDRP